MTAREYRARSRITATPLIKSSLRNPLLNEVRSGDMPLSVAVTFLSGTYAEEFWTHANLKHIEQMRVIVRRLARATRCPGRCDTTTAAPGRHPAPRTPTSTNLSGSTGRTPPTTPRASRGISTGTDSGESDAVAELGDKRGRLLDCLIAEKRLAVP